MEKGRSPSPPRPKGSVRTLWVPCPSRDWPAVNTGHKTEFRHYRPVPLTVKQATLPTPVVLFTRKATFGPPLRKALFVLEAAWSEPLGAISPESLANEGFETLRDFQRYWRDRHVNGRFDRYKIVTANKVRPWRPEDEENFKAIIWNRLFIEPLL